MATTFAIVAVFVPIAFMSGIIGRFFFQFGAHRRGGRAGVAVRAASRSTRCCRRSGTTRRARASSRRPGSAASWTASSAASSGCTRSTAASSSGRSRHRKSVHRHRAGLVLRQLPRAAAGGHRIRAGHRPELPVPSPQHAGRLESRVHRRQGAAGRGGAEGLSRDRADDDDHRNRGRPQLRARQPEARRPRQARPLAEGIRAVDPHRTEAHSRHRARVRLRPSRLGEPARTRSGNDDEADRRVRGQGREDPRHRGPRDLGEGQRIRRCRSASTTTPPPTSASPCSRSARRRGRCSPATRSATGWHPTATTTRSTCSSPKDSRQLSSDIGNLYLTTSKKGPDGEARMVPLRQVADIVESTSPQIIKRQELQRRVALYANAEGRPSGDVNSDVAEDR